MKTPVAATGLTFDWPRREDFPFILFGCVFLSLVFHVASFFVFQVVYPQRVTIPPPPPQVALLTPSSPENKALLRWIAAEDPALVARAHSVTPPGLLDVPYCPSYETVRTLPRGSVEPPVTIEYPPSRPPLSIVRSSAPRRPVATTPPQGPATSQVAFSETLGDRSPISAPVFSWRNRASEPLEPVRVLIGVTDRGEVRFALLQTPPRNEKMDREAVEQLERLRFPPAAAPITWAFATLSFGQDAYAAPPPKP